MIKHFRFVLIALFVSGYSYARVEGPQYPALNPLQEGEGFKAQPELLRIQESFRQSGEDHSFFQATEEEYGDAWEVEEELNPEQQKQSSPEQRQQGESGDAPYFQEEYFTINGAEEDVSLDPEAKTFALDQINPLSQGISLLDAAKESSDLNQIDLLHWVRHQAEAVVPEKYKRKQHFGRWIRDPSKQSCLNIRGLVLKNSSLGSVSYKATNKCLVEKGHWHDPYTGEEFFDAKAIQIDHFVPLKNAYVSGAWRWGYGKRCHYSNYVGNAFHLMAVSGRENMRKSDRAPDQYLPKNENYICDYVENWLKTKAIWGLRLSVNEAQAIVQTIQNYSCRSETYTLPMGEVLKQKRLVNNIPEACLK